MSHFEELYYMRVENNLKEKRLGTVSSKTNFVVARIRFIVGTFQR